MTPPPRPRAAKRETVPAEPSRIAGHTILPGERKRIEIPVARLPTQTQLSLPVEVIKGTKPGPRLWLSAAIHGDELNGVEIIHRVLVRLHPGRLYGEILAVPVVNVFGFVHQDRYLPDRRDLNRSFPGSARGSLAARLAHLLLSQVVSRCTHGIDIHTGSHHRINLPQVRGNLQDPVTRGCAEAFGAPVMVHGGAPRGSIRSVATQRGIPILLYEAGEPLRINPEGVTIGVRGILRVMGHLGMIRNAPPRSRASVEVAERTWVRAKRSGILRLRFGLGHEVRKGETLGSVHDVFGEEKGHVTAPCDGILIGQTNNPLVNQGDGIAHLAQRVAAPTLWTRQGSIDRDPKPVDAVRRMRSRRGRRD